MQLVTHSGLALTGLALGILATVNPTTAAAQPVFTQQPIIVNGNANVDATSINDYYSIVATLFDASNTATGGVLLKGGTITPIPTPYPGDGPTHLQVIDNDGDILGYTQNLGLNIPDMFLLRNGVADPNYDIALIKPFGTQGLTQPNPIGLARRGIIFYTSIIDLSAPTDPSYGVPPRLANTPQFSQFQTIESINATGMVAGIAYGLGGPKQVFTGRGASFITLTPPGAVSVSGGYINDANTVAGSYTDTAGAPHGFIYAAGAYTTFDMPTQAQSITVTAISATGRVVGSYASQPSGVQHMFRYNGSTVAVFGDAPANTTIAVALNARNDMVVSVQSGLAYRSFAVRCSGPGC